MTHDQVRQLVRRINPIPDPSKLESDDAPVLDLEGSMDMQVDERPMAEEARGSRWRGPLIGIAAAAVVLVGGLVYVNTNRDPVAAPAPNAVELPGEFEQSVSPGAYFVDTDGVVETSTRGTFVIEDNEWASLGAGLFRETQGGSIDAGRYVSLIFGELDQVWEDPCAGLASAPAGTTAEALGDQFAAMPGFITLEELTPVTAFGHDGYHLVLEVPAGCTASGTHNVWLSKNWGERYYQVEGQIAEYWFLDVEDTTVMVEAAWPPQLSEAWVPELNAHLDALLETLVITP